MKHDRMSCSTLARLFEELLEWSVILGDRELPLDCTFSWKYVPDPPPELVNRLGEAGEHFKECDFDYYVTVVKKGERPPSNTLRERWEREDSILHMKDVGHESFRGIGDKLGMSHKTVYGIYKRRKMEKGRK